MKYTLLGLLLILSSLVYAEDRYVSDVLYVPLRSGAGYDYRIVNKGLKSGTKLEFIALSEDNEWSNVRTTRGVEGWIPTRYLANIPIAAERLILAERELTQLKSQLADSASNLKNLESSNTESSGRVQNLENQNAELAEELASIKELSANTLQINARNNQLLEENQMLKNELDVVKLERQRLEANKESQQWMIGASIMVVGGLFGFLLPKLSRGRRTDSWG